MEPAPGHTPGHVTIHVKGGGQEAIMSGDIIHHPILLAEPGLQMYADFDAEMGRLLTFLLYTGCRISEALALKWENVDLAQRMAFIETSKNDDPRSMKLRQDLCDLLDPHRKASGRVFRFTQGGHRNFIFLKSLLSFFQSFAHKMFSRKNS
jgi:integrase